MKLTRETKCWLVADDNSVQPCHPGYVGNNEAVYTTVEEARQAAFEKLNAEADQHAATATALRQRAEQVAEGKDS